MPIPEPAMSQVSWLNMDVDADEPTEKQKKLLKKREEFETHIRNNAWLIPNYRGNSNIRVASRHLNNILVNWLA